MQNTDTDMKKFVEAFKEYTNMCKGYDVLFSRFVNVLKNNLDDFNVTDVDDITINDVAKKSMEYYKSKRNIGKFTICFVNEFLSNFDLKIAPKIAFEITVTGVNDKIKQETIALEINAALSKLHYTINSDNFAINFK